MSQIITIKQSDIEAVENATDLYNQAFERGSYYFELKSLMTDMLTDDNKILLKTIGMIVGHNSENLRAELVNKYLNYALAQLEVKVDYFKHLIESSNFQGYQINYNASDTLISSAVNLINQQIGVLGYYAGYLIEHQPKQPTRSSILTIGEFLEAEEYTKQCAAYHSALELFMLAFNQFTGEDIASKEVDKFINVIKQSLVDQYSKLFSLMKSGQIEPELLFVDQNNQPGLNSTRTDYVAIKGCEIQLKYGSKSADMERHSFLTKAPKIDDESLRSYRFYLPQFGFLSLETATKKAVKEWLKVQRLSRQVYNIAYDYEIDLKIILENDHAYAFVQGYTLTRFKDGAYALVCSETLQRRHLKGITKARMTFLGLGKPLINYNDKIDPGPYKAVLEKLYPGLEY